METVINIGYLVAAVLFILGIKGMTKPKTPLLRRQRQMCIRDRTDMPELVAALNGIGGGASLLVASANYLESQKLAEMGQFVPTYDWSIAVILSILIGAVTLTGSFSAVGKLK